MNFDLRPYLISDIVMVNVSDFVVNFSYSTTDKEEIKMSGRMKKMLSIFCTTTLIVAVWKRKGKYCTAAWCLPSCGRQYSVPVEESVLCLFKSKKKSFLRQATQILEEYCFEDRWSHIIILMAFHHLQIFF